VIKNITQNCCQNRYMFI